MGEFTKKLNDGKWQSVDGKVYETRSGAYKRSKKINLKNSEPEPEPEPDIIEKEQSDKVDDESPNWAEQDFTVELDDDNDVETIPAILKKLKPSTTVRRGKMSKKELDAERSTSVAITKIGYRGADLILTKYKRIMMEDPNSTPIEHSEEDLEWISNIGVDALEYNGINVSKAIGPNQIFLISNSGWFGVPLWKISKESERSPFKGKIKGSFGRFLERVPFIGKRIKTKRSPETIIEEDV